MPSTTRPIQTSAFTMPWLTLFPTSPTASQPRVRACHGAGAVNHQRAALRVGSHRGLWHLQHQRDVRLQWTIADDGPSKPHIWAEHGECLETLVAVAKVVNIRSRILREGRITDGALVDAGFVVTHFGGLES
eukprot:141232-Prymnesium_polylepis.1